jgi:hypothetical protein
MNHKRLAAKPLEGRWSEESSPIPVGRLPSTQPWHGREDKQHGEVCGTGNRIPAGDVLAHTSCHRYSEQQFCQYQQCEGDDPDKEPGAGRAYCSELANDIASGEEDCDEHERHFCEFGIALTDAWNEKRQPDGAENKTHPKDDTEVHRGGSQQSAEVVAFGWMGVHGA